MQLKLLLAGAVFAASMATASNAYVVIGTESETTGFVGNFLESVFPGTLYMVGSDGEASFDPFGAGYDTTDGIDFSAVGFDWAQADDSSWTSLGSQKWVLPAVIPGCGVENSTTCEPVGHFISGASWNPLAVGTWAILDADGKLSDLIVTYNSANGAELKFYSDPSLGVPEPASWALMITGFGLVGGALRGRQRVAAATVA